MFALFVKNIMKVLICCSIASEVAHLKDLLSTYTIDTERVFDAIDHPKKKFIQSYHREGMDIDLAILGNTSIEASFQMGRILSIKKYHIALLIGYCDSISDLASAGELVNIINEKLEDAEIGEDGVTKSLYQTGLIDSNEFPHIRGGFINMTNAYFNVFLDIKKVASLTSTIMYKTPCDAVEKIIEQHKVSVVSKNGLGMVYPCLWNQQPFYQLRLVNYEVKTQNNIENASEKLGFQIDQILNLIK